MIGQVEPLRLPHVEWSLIAPELILIGGALALLVAGTFRRDRAMATVSCVFTVAVGLAAMVAAWGIWEDVGGEEGAARLAVADAVVVDGYGIFFTIVICSAVVLGALLAHGYLRQENLESPSFLVLMMLSASGGVVMAKANDLILIFLGLEILSIALYVLAGYHQRRDQSREAAIKYFVLGSFSSAFFLYGVALTYGATGSTNLGFVAAFLGTQTVTGGVLLGGFALLLVGLGFKVAAVPFHMWTPDVYQGAPTPVTGFMAAAAKAAGFAALLRIFFSAFGTERLDWQPIVWVLAVLSMVVGSVLAVVQTDVKRMLAYSSISHAGYVLIGLQAANDRGIAGSLFYLLAYTFLIVGSFAVVGLVSRKGDDRTGLQAYRGLAHDRPVLAFAFTVFLLAQAGVPFTSGFLAKFYVISAAVEAGSYAIAIIAMLAAVVAAFFYLRLIVVMYMGEEQALPGVDPVAPEASGGGVATAVATVSRVEIPVAAAIAIGVALAFTVAAGLIPEPVLDFARHATLLRL
ncbi:MAG TPA: NADH-quinone oxidoreductase subunit N [Acidimicrobiales bacterium]|nr:NADH-quinone oxidoreductase subunit N [Acidimicrobiales bacterium]